MKKISFLLIVTILMLSCATFTPAITPTPTLVPIAVTPNPLPEPTDPTQVITVKSNENFDVVLPANPSTGYHWQLVAVPDANFIQSVGQNYLSEQAAMPGSGGMDVWTFQALNPGETTVTLGYYPPGNETQPDETVIFTVRIE